jgi:uncharacterized protein
MQLDDAGALLLSPSDLAAHLSCMHLTQLAAAVQRGEIPPPPPRDNPHADLIARKGDEHEAAVLAGLAAEGREIVEIGFGSEGIDAAARRTEEALRAGADVVYQGVLASSGWRGLADFLVRSDEPSGLGSFSYEAWDTKLARSAKPAAVLQLTFYSHELERIQGRLPERMRVVLGTGEDEWFRPADFAAFYRRAQLRLEAAIAERADVYPYPVEHCGLCAFAQRCNERWDRDDYLVRVANIRRDQIERLSLAGITTLEALGDAPPGTKVPHVAAGTFETLRHQAELQLFARRTGEQRYELLEPSERRGLALLPEPSPGDLFYDIEGDPYWEPGKGLEYLHGITDAERSFSAIWAHDRAEERRALERVIGTFQGRLAAYPDMHVYHYASYETSALKRLTAEHGILEDELDDLLRQEVFCDLLTVTRQALRISYASYSIKKVREFFMTTSEELAGGGDAIVEYERWLVEREQAILDAIERYNEEDCLSNLLLRNWLLERREEAEAKFAVAIPWRPAPESKEPDEEAAEWQAERESLKRALQATGDKALTLMADLLEYHRREARPVWWWFFARCEMVEDELIEDSESIGALVPDGSRPEPDNRSLVHGFRFPAQQHKLDPGDTVFDPVTRKRAGEIVAVDGVEGTVRLRRGPKLAEAPLPTGLIPGGPYTTRDQQTALMRVGQSLLAGDGRYPHLERLLRREPPLGGTRVQCSTLEEMGRLVIEVEGSYLFVQGPPGAGKTWTGARLVTYLIALGKRGAIASQSHKAIHKLLSEIEADALAEGVPLSGLKKASSGNAESYYEGSGLIETTTNADVFAEADHDLFAGTAWLLTRGELDGALGYLFVDEAGQTSLADALALGTCGRTIVLLGDPVQLAQVTQGVHPGDAGRSVLAHLLGDRATVAEDMGLFLERSFRMHPDVCRYVSDAFYEGRLYSAEDCATQGSSFGTGIRWLPVEHEGNSTSSEEEAARIGIEIERLLLGTWTDAHAAEHAITEGDVMVVAPYNAQVKLLQERLPEGVAVGTVDKFQGQQAPVVFFSMASSSGADAPRGIDFLMSRNRLNVAVSRAQCLAYLVCAPALLDVDCKTVEHMRLANALCRFVELADPA